MEFSKQGHTSNIVITLNANSAVEPWNLSFNCKHQALSILVDEAESQSIYIYKVGTEAQ
jgi:membrane-bound inhibitor of C-type lysozyme